MFEGNKFYCVEEVVSYDSWGQKVLKPRFIMTRSYKKYLEEKQKENALKELRGLRAKLEYQKQTYGEVEKLDLDYYEYKAKEYYRIYK